MDIAVSNLITTVTTWILSFPSADISLVSDKINLNSVSVCLNYGSNGFKDGCECFESAERTGIPLTSKIDKSFD